MGIVRDLYYARKMSAGLKLPAPTLALLIKRLRLAASMGGGGIEKTVSGSPAHITDALAKAALSVLVNITPIQPGSGDPSPENVRPISGLTGLSVYVSPTQDPDDATVYNVDWSAQAGTVYHGTVDPVAGQLTVDCAMYTFDGSEAWTASATPHRFSTNINYLPLPIATQPMTQGATQNVLTSVFGECVYTNADGVGYIVHNNSTTLFVVNEPAATTVNDIKAIVTGMQFCYELATPLTYQLSAQEVQMLLGENYVWSSSGDTVSVTYYAEGDANPLQSLNILLGGRYSNPKTADDVSDKEALEIILGGNK